MLANLKISIVENKKDWDDFLYQCNNVNLLQTWEYGEGKRNAEGWLPIPNIIMNAYEPLCAVQILVKKIPFLGGIARINRAPLFVSSNNKFKPDNGTVIQALRFLYYHWVERQKFILYIAPNILQDEVGCEALEEIGFHRADDNAWSSALIDLSLEENDLRKNLHQSWRRNLSNRSEKMQLMLEIENSANGFSFLMDKYNQTMIEKDFSGPPERLLRELRNATKHASSVQVMFACKDEERIGGIFIVGYLDTCHYLVGWNSQKGRILRAHYFLFWQSLLYFKRMGYHWFDLGGVNEKLFPGITQFKRGLGGREYTLIGEFEAFPRTFFSRILKQLIKLKLRYKP